MKRVVKQLAGATALLAVSPILVLHGLFHFLLLEGVFSTAAQFLSLVPGKTGSYLRIAFYRVAMRHCAADCFIGFGTLFSQVDTEIGTGVYIGPQCNIGSCRIGADTLIASGVHIMSGTGQHRFDDLETPIRDQGGTFEKIMIGKDTWIGNGALVMANIGNHCVIGAGSVVTSDIPDYAIAVGNPARVLRSRMHASATDD